MDPFNHINFIFNDHSSNPASTSQIQSVICTNSGLVSSSQSQVNQMTLTQNPVNVQSSIPSIMADNSQMSLLSGNRNFMTLIQLNPQQSIVTNSSSLKSIGTELDHIPTTTYEHKEILLSSGYPTSEICTLEYPNTKAIIDGTKTVYVSEKFDNIPTTPFKIFRTSDVDTIDYSNSDTEKSIVYIKEKPQIESCLISEENELGKIEQVKLHPHFKEDSFLQNDEIDEETKEDGEVIEELEEEDASKKGFEEVPSNEVCGICKTKIYPKEIVKDMFEDTISSCPLAKYIVSVLRRPYRDIVSYPEKLVCFNCFQVLERINELQSAYGTIREELTELREKIRNYMNERPYTKNNAVVKAPSNNPDESDAKEEDVEKASHQMTRRRGRSKGLEDDTTKEENNFEFDDALPKVDSPLKCPSKGVKEITFHELIFTPPVEKKFSCKICNRFDGEIVSELTKHFDAAHGEDCIVECQLCLQTFSGGVGCFLKHMLAEHPKRSAKETTAIFTISERKLFKRKKIWRPGKKSCQHCGKSFSGNTKLKIHINDVHLHEYIHKCSLCSTMFKHSYELIVHKRKAHNIIKEKKKLKKLCEYCNKYFSQQNFARHLNDIHLKKTKYKCSICPLVFKHSSQLVSHKRNTHNMMSPSVKSEKRKVYIQKICKKYLCSLCGKSYPCDSYLQRHIALTHVSKTTNAPVCEFCGVEFLTLDLLKDHMKMHQDSGQTTYSCNFCGKNYATIRALKIHKQVHNKQEKHPEFPEIGESCFVCGKVVQSKLILKKHIEGTHMNEVTKMPRCEYCTNEFNTLEDLKNHITIHIASGQLNCPCNLCCKSFKSMRALKVHKNLAHKLEDAYYGCKLCGKMDFKRSVDVYYHVKKLHVGVARKDIMIGPFRYGGNGEIVFLPEHC